MLKYFIMTIVATLFFSLSQASAETMPMNKNMDNTMHQQKMIQECESEMMMNKTYSKEECVKYKMMQNEMMMNNWMMQKKMMTNKRMMTGGDGMMQIHMSILIITLIFSWILMSLGIVALWKWIKT